MAKRLFVGGLSYSVTDSQLNEMFSQIGTVVSATVIIDRMTGNSKGFGFVEMEKEEDADKAIQTLNGKEIDGRKIAVNEARPKPEQTGGGYQPRPSYDRKNSRSFDRRGGRGRRFN